MPPMPSASTGPRRQLAAVLQKPSLCNAVIVTVAAGVAVESVSPV